MFYVVENLPEYINKFASYVAQADIPDPDFGVAILKEGYVDIELNLCIGNTEDGHHTYFPSYFICTRGKNEMWESAGYPDDYDDKYAVSVDFSALNWKEQLEKDMEEKLALAVEQFGLKIDGPNWDDDGLMLLRNKISDS